MGPSVKEEDSFGDINHVLDNLMTKERAISKHSFGKTGLKDIGLRVGSMMSSIEKWLVEARPYEITGAAILLSLCFVVFFMGLRFGQMIQSRRNEIYIGNRRYEIIGLGEVNANGKIVYTPIYEERK